MRSSMRRSAENDADNLLNSTQLAALLNCCERSLANYVQAGRIPPPVRIGRLVRWPRSIVSDLIASGI